jgi:hypothetical protein
VCKASPGYVVANQHRIPKETFEFTEEGTRAHEAAKQLLTGGKPVYDPGDMKSHVEGYRNFIINAKGKDDVTLIVESAVKVFFAPGRKGYVDVALVYVGKNGKVRRLHIIDLKYGRGVSVHAKRNPQLSSYAKGLIEDLGDVYDFSDPAMEVAITIWQPRVTGEEAERTWELTRRELEEFCTNIKDTAVDIQAEPFKQPFAPSDDTCTFCPAFSFCEARTRWLLGEVEDVIDLAPAVLDKKSELPELPAPEGLTADQLARILSMKPLFSKWLEKVQAYVVASALQHGVEYNGFKVVATKPHKKWADEDAAYKILKGRLGADVAAPRELITPAKAKELLKAKGVTRRSTMQAVEALIVQPGGNPTLAPLDDKRPVWKDTKASDEFEDESITAEDKSLL